MNSRTKCFLLNLLSGFIVVLICAASFFALVNIVFNSVYIKTEVEGFSMLPTLNTTVPTSTEEGDVIPATGEHNYVGGVCTVCKAQEPTVVDYSGKYYIATIRTSGNYFYMISDLGTASTKRYQAVDSGLITLPASITDSADGYVFVLEKNTDGTYCIYAEGVNGDNYLGWTSGNSGTLVEQNDAIKFTVDVTEGIYNIHFAASDGERYLSLNSSTSSNYFAFYKGTQIQDLVLVPVEPEPECTHSNLEWVYDDPQHWQKCTAEGCDYTTEKTAHSYEETITTNATCTSEGLKTFTYLVTLDKAIPFSAPAGGIRLHHNGPLYTYPLGGRNTSGSWDNLSGKISGVTRNDFMHNKWAPGAVTAKFGLQINAKEPDAVTEVKNLKLVIE